MRRPSRRLLRSLGLKHINVATRLKQLSLFKKVKMSLRREVSSQYLKGDHKGNQAALLVVADRKTRSNIHELWLTTFRIYFRENSLPRGLLEESCKNRLPKLSVEAIKTHWEKPIELTLAGQLVKAVHWAECWTRQPPEVPYTSYFYGQNVFWKFEGTFPRSLLTSYTYTH